MFKKGHLIEKTFKNELGAPHTQNFQVQDP
jgi:hypothetical protein